MIASFLPWAIGLLMVYLVLPKKQEASTVDLALPYRPAMKLDPKVEHYQKLLEVKRFLISQGMPAAEADEKFSDIEPHLSKEAS